MRSLDTTGSEIREFPQQNDDPDTSGRSWTVPNVIRNEGAWRVAGLRVEAVSTARRRSSPRSSSTCLWLSCGRTDAGQPAPCAASTFYSMPATGST